MGKQTAALLLSKVVSSSIFFKNGLVIFNDRPKTEENQNGQETSIRFIL